ncbi:MAG TPA: hypothetical protein VFQ77_14225 [Pseudonocardiaceae bacterium]|jgi:hypothetical protein|nr:hypothetical protein [Pseudonocardiaceae bacterium]
MANLVESEAVKVRLGDPEDRRWLWVAKALAAQLGIRGAERDQAVAAVRFVAPLSALGRLVGGESARFAVVVCVDAADCAAAVTEARRLVAGGESHLESVVVVLRAGGALDASVRYVLVASGCEVTQRLAGLAPEGSVEIVDRIEAAEPAPGEVAPGVVPDEGTAVALDLTLWVRMLAGQEESGDFWLAPANAASAVGPGDWVVGARPTGDGGAVAAVSVARVGSVARAGDLTAISFDRFRRLPADAPAPGVHLDTLPDDPHELVEVPAAALGTLIPGVGPEFLIQLPATLGALTAAAIARLLPAQYGDIAAQSVAALRAGRHVILRGTSGAGTTEVGLAVLRHARELGISPDVLVVPGRGPAGVHGAPTDGPPYADPFGYRPSTDYGQDLRARPTPTDVAVYGAARSGTWILVDDLRREGAPGLVAGFGAAVAEAYSDATRNGGVPPIAGAPGGNWRMVVTTSLSVADIADLIGDGLVGWFAILDLDQVPPSGEPDQSWDDFAPELGADGTLLVRRLELLNIPQLSASPGRMRGVVRLAVESLRVALQEGRSLSGREALLGALDVLVRPILTGTSGQGQPSWAEVDAAMSA